MAHALARKKTLAGDHAPSSSESRDDRLSPRARDDFARVPTHRSFAPDSASRRPRRRRPARAATIRYRYRDEMAQCLHRLLHNEELDMRTFLLMRLMPAFCRLVEVHEVMAPKLIHKALLISRPARARLSDDLRASRRVPPPNAPWRMSRPIIMVRATRRRRRRASVSPAVSFPAAHRGHAEASDMRGRRPRLLRAFLITTYISMRMHHIRCRYRGASFDRHRSSSSSVTFSSEQPRFIGRRHAKCPPGTSSAEILP